MLKELRLGEQFHVLLSSTFGSGGRVRIRTDRIEGESSMGNLKKVFAEEGVRRDTTVVPPLREILAVAAMFAGILAVFVR
jgi:hypothetical protein